MDINLSLDIVIFVQQFTYRGMKKAEHHSVMIHFLLNLRVIFCLIPILKFISKLFFFLLQKGFTFRSILLLL